jgi:hypothetical protein
MSCFALRRSDLGFVPRSHYAATPAAMPSGYGPSSLQAAYNLPSSTAGGGQRIYIVDAYDDPNAEADLAAYRSQYGLPACTTANGCFRKLNESGAASPLPTADSGWAGEESLDLDMVSATCPNCGITLIEASSSYDSDLFTGVRTATDTLGGKFVSMSFGGSESSTDTSYDSTYFHSSGVVYTASSGDSAYGASYPATSADVTAVGGTSLTAASNARGWSEKVWYTNATEGTGSGCSAYVGKPSWQSSITSCSRRAEADVSAVADPATGVAVYQTYGGSGWTVYGGTSASAPIIASVYALAGAPASGTRMNSLPYSQTASLYDVTSGSNGTCGGSNLCTAGTGWDGPTGLGTPHGTAAFGGASSSGNTVTVTNPGKQSGAAGSPVSLQLQASDSSAGATVTFSATGLPAGLSISQSGLISGSPTTGGTYSVTVTATDSTGASGSTSFTWTISSSGCSGQKLLNPGFESGATSWSQTSGVIATDGAHSRTGTGYAWLDGYGRAHTDTLSQSVTVPSGCTGTLTYYLWISSSEGTAAAYDKLTLAVNGTTKQTLSNVDKGSGYVLRTVPLTGYSGTVTVKWTGTEDSSLQTSFLIDDTALTLS